MDDHLLRFNKTDEFVFIDVETFNLCLNIENNLPWQISMLKVKGNDIVNHKDMLVKWETDLKISADAARITRHDPNKVQKLGISPEEAFEQMYDWLCSAHKIVGHNIFGFDIYLIRGLCKKFNKPWKQFVNKIIDTNCIAKGIKFGELPTKDENITEYQYRMCNVFRKGVKTSLSALGKEFSISHDYERLHDALVDLELNLKVWNKLKFMIDL